MSKRKQTLEKKIKKRKHKRMLMVTLNILLILLILCAVAALTIWLLCDVKKVTYSGSELYDDEAIEPYVFTDEYCKNSVYCFIKNRFFNEVSIPFVKEVKVSLQDPNTVSVEVTDKEMVAMMIDKDGAFVYFDRENVVQEVSMVLLPDRPLVVMEDVELKDLSIGEPLPLKSKRNKELKKLISCIEEENVPVDKITFAADGTVTMICSDITVDLGSSANTDAKILRLKYILPKLEGEKGTLHLEDWDEGNRDIVFKRGT